MCIDALLTQPHAYKRERSGRTRGGREREKTHGAVPVTDRVPTPTGTRSVQDFAVLIVCFKLVEYISSVNQRLLF